MHFWVFYTTRGNMYIRISMVKSCINSDIHLVHEFPCALQWNCSLASRFNLDRISNTKKKKYMLAEYSVLGDGQLLSTSVSQASASELLVLSLSSVKSGPDI